MIRQVLIPTAAVIFSAMALGPTRLSAAPLIADFSASPLIVNNDTLDFGPGGDQNISASFDTAIAAL